MVKELSLFDLVLVDIDVLRTVGRPLNAVPGPSWVPVLSTWALVPLQCRGQHLE